MKIIPAIDLMGGRCVQLIGGDPSTKKDFGDPIEMARYWKGLGASMLHIIDLDATLGLGQNIETVKRIILEADIPCQFGGGIRSFERVGELMDELPEKAKIIVGTLAVNDYPDFEGLTEVKDAKDRLLVSVDSKDGYVAVRGWQKKSTIKPTQLIEKCQDLVWGFLFTNVDVEGKMEGFDEPFMKEVVTSSKKPVIVSGGISSFDDINTCRVTGAWGVVLGKAIYEKRIDVGGLF